MGLRGAVILLVAVLSFTAIPAFAQSDPPREGLTLTSSLAATWTAGKDNVILLHGPVHITLDHTTLTADDAVVWLAPATPGDLEVQDARIALLGHAKLEQAASTRTGDQLFVKAQVSSQGIRIVADERIARDDSKSDLVVKANVLRHAEEGATAELPLNPPTTRTGTTSRPASRPQTRLARPAAIETPVLFEAQTLETLNADDGNVAIVLTGGVRIIERRPTGDYLELSADSAVLFTRLKSLKELQKAGGKKQGREPIVAAYLQGDVRIDFVPVKPGVPEQRLTGERVYYEFGTDRAVLTDAIVHTIEPHRGTPLMMRAKLVRQLSQGEFATENVRLTTSSFAVPSYSIAAEKLYLRDEPTGDPRIGDKVYFQARNTTLQAFDIPFFYLPVASGELSRGIALRGLGGGNSNNFGTFAQTLWGLFETLGQAPPRDLDVNYRLDYYSKRGPAFGANAKYGGGFTTDTTRQPWDFEGELKSYFVYDDGTDVLGRLPERVNNPSTLRGQLLWEHQHFFPDGWQAQVRLGYVSDPTFLEQWFRDDFQNGPPRNFMGYLKHQVDSEAFTVGATWQPNHIVTTSNDVQEQFEVDRLPQVGYYREGDSLLGDRLTLFSENEGGGLHFARSRDVLKDQGFSKPSLTPGQPAEGYTGVTDDVIWRGDFRQELDFPFTLGPIRIAPYVMGRYTQYSNSPQTAERARGLVGAGTRLTTELWKVDPTAESDLFDLHQIRHVIEPEVNFFTSASDIERNQVYVFDQRVDAINDVSAAQFAIHQRWETKRGGPGQWRNVDAFTLNVEVDVFENKPPKAFHNPYDFRGLYFTSYPEESVPRDALNADASWRLSDNTVLLGDMSFNLDRGSLQTLALGVLVRRDTRLAYFIGNRYISELNSNITSVHVDYEITSKYTIDLDQEFDFTQGKNVYSSLALIRKFDTFLMAFRYFFDETTNENSISFNIYPAGLGTGLDTTSFNTFRK